MNELQDLRLLDSPPEERFDRSTRLAIRLFGVQTALVSLVDHERQWFKSRQGPEAPEAPRSISFCGHAIMNDGPFVIEDASKDARFADNPMGFDTLGTDSTELKGLYRMKSEFVSTVSHELRTPLTSIRGSLGLLSSGVEGAVPDAVRNLIDIAKNNWERLIRLINGILDTEKIESGQMRLALQVVALQPLLQQTLAANDGFASQHGVTLQLHAPGEPMLVNIDTDRICLRTSTPCRFALRWLFFLPPMGPMAMTAGPLPFL